MTQPKHTPASFSGSARATRRPARRSSSVRSTGCGFASARCWRYPAVHRDHATSDVLQEVLLDLNGTLTRLTPRNVRHFLGLAGQRIRWKLIDLARRPEPACLPTDDLVGAAAETTYDPVRLAQWEEIHSYIQELPEDERELFDLIFYQGVPQPVVAEMLGIPYRTLKYRWQEARLRFMARFDGGPF